MEHVLAIDIGYQEDQAFCAGLVFHWDAEQPLKQYTAIMENIAPYIPGQFYQRELPCLMAIIQQLDINEIDAIVVDGYVHLDEGKKGLGAHLYEVIEQKVPVIGVAKRSYHQNEANVSEVYHRGSKSPLYITAIGTDRDLAAEKVGQMKGAYRIPTLLKMLDRLSKSTG